MGIRFCERKNSFVFPRRGCQKMQSLCLFVQSAFTGRSNMEASLAVLACRSRLRADPVLLRLIVQYLLVPLPRVVLNLRRIEGRRLSPRMKKGEGKGLKTLAISPNGQLV